MKLETKLDGGLFGAIFKRYKNKPNYVADEMLNEEEDGAPQLKAHSWENEEQR